MVRNFAELDLDDDLLSAIEAKGYERPTEVQAKAIPVAMDGRDILASAPTGTGKTAAFLLPMLQHLIDFPRRKPGPARTLILTPTRELAIQIADEARELAANTDLKIFTITGGISYDEHADILGKTQDLVVATPGRLMEYIKSERFDCRAIECLILDEADRMLDMGFGPIVDTLSNECRWRRQTLLFSATLESKGVHGFTEDLLKEPERIDAMPSRRERKKIHQWYYRCDDMDHKLQLLEFVLRNEAERAIVFVKTRERLAALRERLDSMQIPCCWLQGEMAQASRNSTIERFKSGKANIMLATDVAARGIDLPDISHVINFDLPRTSDIYLHRIGRTARAGKKGAAISLVEAHDQSMMERIGRYMKEPVKERMVEGLKPQHKMPIASRRKKKQKDMPGAARKARKAASKK